MTLEYLLMIFGGVWINSKEAGVLTKEQLESMGLKVSLELLADDQYRYHVEAVEDPDTGKWAAILRRYLDESRD